MNKLSPLVYIILLNYNGLKDTIDCVESLEKNTYKNYKIIIVDNDSADNSVEVLSSKYKAHTIMPTGDNLGFAGGNNVGIKYAMEKGADYILLLNNDTVVEKDFLSIMVDRVEENSEIGIITCKAYYFNSNRIWYAGGDINTLKGNASHAGYNEIDNGQYDEEKYVGFASGCCMLLSRKAILDTGLMTEDYFLYYEDTDYCCRIKNSGYKIFYCPRAVIYHKVSASTKASSPMYNYYYTRNRCFFIKRNIKGLKKFTGYTYFIVRMIAKGELFKKNVKYIYIGLIDFAKGKTGLKKL